jgi:hypothetical protein
MLDILTWLWAVLNNWAGYLTGGLLIASATFWAIWKDRPVPRTALLILSGLFLVMALYKAWQDKHIALTSADRMIAKLEKDLSETKDALAEEKGKRTPDLQMEMKFLSIGHVKDESTGITVVASVTNLGMPSIVQNYLLRIELPSRGQLVVGPVHFEGMVTLERENQPGLSFTSKDVLYDKTATNPIATGGRAEGLLIFLLEGVSRDEVQAAKESLVLSCQDVTGKLSEAKYPKQDKAIEAIPHFPGVISHPVPPSKSPRQR